eukprot:CAMPEP_0180426488 /NCGR_PEP_ID=MMETSP1036_2-20121128/5823_1 /TAXON_ID=632150 /ORGANISM="Azadinium spinosum, Strain 3D9" /LENGTH=118 /DNA_ID=CAMNT_0022432047 /DNA_START=45 /DNA_END=401 /DNA_ORIENTATION=-
MALRRPAVGIGDVHAEAGATHILAKLRLRWATIAAVVIEPTLRLEAQRDVVVRRAEAVQEMSVAELARQELTGRVDEEPPQLLRPDCHVEVLRAGTIIRLELLPLGVGLQPRVVPPRV